MIKGRGGVFEVTWGNDVLFSKRQTGRFPRPDEVEMVVGQRLAADDPPA